MSRHLIRAALLLLPLLAAPFNARPALAADIEARFELDLAPGDATSAARIVVGQARASLRELVLDGTRLAKADGDGVITRAAGLIRWVPPARGGTLHYRVTLNHRRAGKNVPGNDAFVGPRFALFRGEDAFPVRSWRWARSRSLAGELVVNRPKGWSLVPPYLPDARGHIPISNPGQRLPRPIGWVIAGAIGTRRDSVAGLEITVSAPRGLRMERVAMLGLLRWTLPQLLPGLGLQPDGKALPRYLNIVAAAEPMWLGALSAPNSIFVHADRPLISENGTSTVVHEVVHVLLSGLVTPRDGDWIDEGLAEYFALRALKESGTISAARYAATIAEFRRWGAPVQSLRTAASSGPVTARSVTVFHDLDAELRLGSKGRESLATLIRERLRKGGTTDLAALRDAARDVLGSAAVTLAPTNLPGMAETPRGAFNSRPAM